MIVFLQKKRLCVHMKTKCVYTGITTFMWLLGIDVWCLPQCEPVKLDILC